MNINLIITGLISIVIALILYPFKPRTLKEKRNKPYLSYTEAHVKYSSWGLLIIGIFSVIYGLFNE